MSNEYKGIFLAGGSGTRLYPLTNSVSKQLLPVYDKPMIYYPVSVLMLAGIKDILIISTPEDIESYRRLLGDGENLGVNFQYMVQENPNGLAEAFILGDDFIGSSKVALILGDNIFYGQNFSENLKKATHSNSGATIFGYHVNNPSDFGVIEFDSCGGVKSIIEKPLEPKSNYAVTGLYFYNNDVVKIAKSVTPSDRGELEITDINNEYIMMNDLSVEILGRGFAWLDTGTHDALINAGQFIYTLEKRQGFKIGCIEEIAFQNDWISKDRLLEISDKLIKTDYGKYIKNVANNFK